MKKIIIFSITVFLINLYFTGEILAASATYSLSPSSGTYNAGNNLDLNVILNTGGARSSGADMTVTYDPVKLKLVDIINGTLYPKYVGKAIDNTTGKANISGLANTDGTGFYTGTGTFVTLRFQGLTAGAAAVSFPYVAQSTSDNVNIMDGDSNSDAVTSVVNGTYNIVGTYSGSSGTVPTQAPLAGGTGGSELPDAGVSLPTIISMASGTLFLLLGFLTFRKR